MLEYLIRDNFRPTSVLFIEPIITSICLRVVPKTLCWKKNSSRYVIQFCSCANGRKAVIILSYL